PGVARSHRRQRGRAHPVRTPPDPGRAASGPTRPRPHLRRRPHRGRRILATAPRRTTHRITYAPGPGPTPDCSPDLRPPAPAPARGPRPAAPNEDRQIPCQIRPETARNLPIPGRTGQGWRGRVAVRAPAHAPARGRPTGIRERLTKLRIRKDATPCAHARERGARKRGSARARERANAGEGTRGRGRTERPTAPPGFSGRGPLAEPPVHPSGGL